MLKLHLNLCRHGDRKLSQSPATTVSSAVWKMKRVLPSTTDLSLADCAACVSYSFTRWQHGYITDSVQYFQSLQRSGFVAKFGPK